MDFAQTSTHLLVLVVFVIQVQLTQSIDCFFCNAFVPSKKSTCPSSSITGSEEILRWKSTNNKYSKFNTKFCRIVVLENGTIADQSGVGLCTNNVEEPIRINNNKFLVGRKYCCTNSGCNWSVDSASQNLELEAVLNPKLTTSATFGAKQSRNLEDSPTTANPIAGPLNNTANNSTLEDSECGPFCVLSANVTWQVSIIAFIVAVVLICLVASYMLFAPTKCYKRTVIPW